MKVEFSATLELQLEIQELVKQSFLKTKNLDLKREKHVAFIRNPIQDGLNRWFVALDASKPWIIYWILHSMYLLDISIPKDIQDRALNTLSECQNDSGGFGGGKGQISHLATTYAAVNSIAIIGTHQAFNLVKRRELYSFLIQMKQRDGSFRMHEDGEIDIRGSYCALVLIHYLYLPRLELLNKVPQFLGQCQTYEGGVGPVPGVEAHGGYTFCGIAALFLVGFERQEAGFDWEKLKYWTAARQMQSEGGFQGRTNKLVDGCYSFWQGGTAILLQGYDKYTGNPNPNAFQGFDRERLFEYIYASCQAPDGGLRDKPGKHADFYHTCYVLSGLSLAQYEYVIEEGVWCVKGVMEGVDEQSLVKPTHPVFNVGFGMVETITAYFESLPTFLL